MQAFPLASHVTKGHVIDTSELLSHDLSVDYDYIIMGWNEN